MVLAAAALAPAPALAKPKVDRKGGQGALLMGAAFCVPGRLADCQPGNDITIGGENQPSFGMGLELGWRANRFVWIGAAYNLGLFNTSVEVLNEGTYDALRQHAVYGVIRPVLPIWRFDFGLDLGFGWSRQVAAFDRDNKDLTQGFSAKIAPVVDIFLGRRLFIGAKADLILNEHREACRVRGDVRTCEKTSRDELAPLNQLIFGVHIGGTFG
jgi:hypothetical protein